VTATAEPAFNSPGWYPPVPFGINSHGPISGSTDTLVTLLGQFDSAGGTERLYDLMSFDTYYSGDPDVQPPAIKYVDGVLNKAAGQGAIKVEATDPSGVVRVLIAYTGASNEWLSHDLTFDPVAIKWKGVITATTDTRYFVQAVDGAGNVGTAHNKGRYYSLLPPVQSGGQIYLPLIVKHGG
jgi:hypothetical protein